jgi:cobaltochelatase CobN
VADAGLVFACAGCCCGHPDTNGSARISKPVWRRTFEAAGLAGRVRFAFTECLGPCSEANVVFLYLHGRARWFRRVNSVELFATLLGYARAAVDAPDAVPPPALAERSFSWTGGGVGPEPV